MRDIKIHGRNLRVSGGRIGSHHGCGVRDILEHRSKKTYDPNLEQLKSDLHNLKLSNSRPTIREIKSKKSGSGNKYIVF